MSESKLKPALSAQLPSFDADVPPNIQAKTLRGWLPQSVLAHYRPYCVGIYGCQARRRTGIDDLPPSPSRWSGQWLGWTRLYRTPGVAAPASARSSFVARRAARPHRPRTESHRVMVADSSCSEPRSPNQTPRLCSRPRLRSRQTAHKWGAGRGQPSDEGARGRDSEPGESAC